VNPGINGLTQTKLGPRAEFQQVADTSAGQQDDHLEADAVAESLGSP